ncbi:MAG: efflux RND transporter periplasmic adaptor subunit [Campylobacterales bacterium]|nr:efflux RND transporter periplasmic adaptor subunit [Campylobacterales bacterium]
MKTVLLSLWCAAVLSAESVYMTFDVVALQESELTLTSTGVIETMRVDVGSRVKAGDVLLALDNDDLERSVALARDDVALSELRARFAQQSFERFKQVRDVMDEERFEEVESAYLQTQAALRRAKTDLSLKEATLQKSILRAPYAGVITKRHKQVGDGVSGAMLSPVLTLIDDSSVKLVAGFDEKYWQKIKPGLHVRYRVDGSDTQREGVIAKVYPSVDPKTRKAYAEVLTEGLMVGLFGEGSIEVE